MVYRRTARSDEVRAASRSRLLDAAWTLFSSQGYDATTMQQIVDAAGTSIGNAYFYFPNKERLLLELVEERAERAWDDSEREVQDVPPGPARIAAIIHANIVGLFEERSELAQLIFSTDQRVSGIAVMGRVSMARWQPHLVACFPNLQPEEREIAAAAIFGANRAVVERALSEGVALDLDRVVPLLIRWSLRGLGSSADEIAAALRVVKRRRSSGGSTRAGSRASARRP